MVGYFLDIYDSNSTVTYAFEALEVDNDTLTCTCSEEFLGSTGVKLLMVRCNILDSNLQEIAQYTSNFVHAIVDKGASVSYVLTIVLQDIILTMDNKLYPIHN